MNASPEQLALWYEIEKRSYRFIMTQLGINNARRVKKLLVDAGIKVRTRSEAVATQWIGNIKRRKAASDHLKLNPKIIAYRTEKRPETHRKKLSEAKLGVKNPMFGKTGHLHHHFLGGKKTWESKRKMSKKARALVFDSLGKLCIRCGEKETSKLTINHKIPWRKVRHHELWNLEVLCRKCHFSGPNRLR